MPSGRPGMERPIQLQKVLAMGGPATKQSHTGFANAGSPLAGHRALSVGTGASSRNPPIQRVSSPLFMASDVSNLDASRNGPEKKMMNDDLDGRSDLTPDFNNSRHQSMPPSATQLASAPVETEA